MSKGKSVEALPFHQTVPEQLGIYRPRTKMNDNLLLYAKLTDNGLKCEMKAMKLLEEVETSLKNKIVQSS